MAAKVRFSLSFQRLDRTCLFAFLAEDAFGRVFPAAGIFVHFDIHRADFQALAALDAFAFVAFYAQHREVAHRFQEHCDRTYVFAEGAVVFQNEGEEDSYHIIQHVAGNEKVKHRGFVRLSEADEQDNDPKR